MKRFIPLLVIALVAGGPLVRAQKLYVSPDVPSDPDGSTLLPWNIIEHAHLSAIPYTLELSVPGDPAIDGLAKMDKPGDWLFSIEAPSDLAGALPNPAEPRDVVRLGAGVFSLFFQGGCVGGVVPLGSDVDAIYLEGGDQNGDLVVSFDVPTTIGAATYQPSELVRYGRSGPLPCGWTLAGSVIDFAAIAGFTYYPTSTNVIGADYAGGDWVLALDIPVDLAPPPGPTTEPGQVVATDGITGWTLFDDLQAEGVPGWPISSLVDALSCQANPGRIESPLAQILLGKNLPQIYIVCPAGCSSGAENYGVYGGTIANIRTGVYDHRQISCSAVCPDNINFIPAATDTYYLVVPYNTRCRTKEEGSYGTDSNAAQRPQATAVIDRCAAVQNLTPCP